MPQFLPSEAFDRDRMDDDERDRFDAAIQAYDAVQKNNAGAQDGLAAAWGMAHRPGPKSALFHRLLSGRPALPFPPPTSFSYPWYAVVEEPGPFSVMLGAQPFGDHGTTLVINQCPWERTGHNDAATALMAFLRDPSTLGWHDEHWHSALNALLDDGPCWTIRYAPWPEMHLVMGRRVIQARRDALVPQRGNPEGGRPQVLRVLRTWEDEATGNEARRAAALAKPEALRCVTEHLLLSAHRADPPLRPGDWDWVEAETNGWQIRRA